MFSDFVKSLSNPGKEYRGAPFWAWNAELEPAELKRQMAILRDMGMGGVFMHSRVGLGTEYLGDDWFRCIDECIKEAERLKIDAWIYDEDRWPSGTAGGKVTTEPKYRARFLELVQMNERPADGEWLAIFAGRLDGGNIINGRRICGVEMPQDGETVFAFRIVVAESSPAYNGGSYLDTLNPEAVRAFIESTHEQYAERFSASFGKTVPGFFTDEPNFFPDPENMLYRLPWTDSIEKLYSEKYDENIADHLLELFYKVNNVGFSRARLQYRQCLCSLFIKGYAKQIGDWCAAHGVKLTGHVLSEDSLSGQTCYVGSAMRFYRYMHIPGIDTLTERWGTFFAVKQCASVARQFGKERCMSELYGATGWDFPLFGHKALGDWQYALGINFRCHHISWYSMKGEAKRDYPASISFHSPWHRYYNQIEDYFARLGTALSFGEAVRDLLVVHPLESYWGSLATIPYFTDEKAQPLNSAPNNDEEFFDFFNKLLYAQVDFDLGDEEHLAEFGRIENDKLQLNLAFYKAVLITPFQKTIRRTTIDLLKRFAESGGAVFYVGALPEYIDGVEAMEEITRQAAGFIKLEPESMNAALQKAAGRLRIVSSKAKELTILHQIRHTDECDVIFLSNFSTPFKGAQMRYEAIADRKMAFPEIRVSVASDKEQNVYECDLWTGRIVNVPSVFSKGAITFSTSFEPLESRLFLLSSDMPSEAVDMRKYVQKTLSLPKGRMPFSLDDMNCMVLDQPLFEGERHYVLSLDAILRERLGATPRGGNMCQPYFRRGEKSESIPITLRYDFFFDDVPEKEILLGIEEPNNYRISVNGLPVDNSPCGWWCDPAIETIRIPADALTNGRNMLEVSIDFHTGLSGLEALYLLGDFAVFDEKHIGVLPKTLAQDDVTKQGLPNYGGNITLHYNINGAAFKDCGASLAFPEWHGAGVVVCLNGGKERFCATPASCVFIPAEEWHDGDNKLDVTVLGHRRNTFGPFYSANEAVCIGPSLFRRFDHPQRNLVPFGMVNK